MNPLKQAQQLYRVRTEWLGEGGQPSPHAQQRAYTCLQCPHNERRGLEEVLKGAVAGAVARQMDLKAKLVGPLEGEDRLHVCTLCSCYLPLKVYVPLEVARENTPDWAGFPDFCWLRTERPQDESST